MNVEISIDNKKFPVGSKTLAQFIEAAEDVPENKSLFDLLASHPSVLVKSEIAAKNNLGQDMFDTLALSGELPVVKNLLTQWNRYCNVKHSYLKDKYFQHLLDSNNSDILVLLIDNIEDYNVGAYSERADILVKHENPDVRLALANSNAPKELRRRLLDDKDVSVRHTAMMSLS